MTRADEIRHMTDDELVEFVHFSGFDCSDYCEDFDNGCYETCTHDKGREYAREWLEEEV